MVIHIAPVGHGAGYLKGAPDDIAFASTNLQLTLYDLLRGGSRTLEFSDFSSPADDPGRYIQLKLPEDNTVGDDFFGARGLNGLFLLEVREESELFSRSDWTEPISGSFGNEAWMQILSASWRTVLAETPVDPRRNVAFMEDTEFRTGPIDPDGTETVEEIFDDLSTFPDFLRISGGIPVDLSSEQKEVIIRDGVMAYLSSQGPILPADAPQTPVVGIGITSSAEDPSTPPQTVVRGDFSGFKGNSVSRLFTLDGIPPAINALESLSDMTGMNNQTKIEFRNPLRVLVSDLDGDSDGDVLDEGMAFATGGTDLVSMDVLSNVSGPTKLSVILSNDSLEAISLEAEDEEESTSSGDSLSDETTGTSSTSSQTQSGVVACDCDDLIWSDWAGETKLGIWDLAANETAAPECIMIVRYQHGTSGVSVFVSSDADSEGSAKTRTVSVGGSESEAAQTITLHESFFGPGIPGGRSGVEGSVYFSGSDGRLALGHWGTVRCGSSIKDFVASGFGDPNANGRYFPAWTEDNADGEARFWVKTSGPVDLEYEFYYLARSYDQYLGAVRYLVIRQTAFTPEDIYGTGSTILYYSDAGATDPANSGVAYSPSVDAPPGVGGIITEVDP
jgi:hypothetical protein